MFLLFFSVFPKIIFLLWLSIFFSLAIIDFLYHRIPNFLLLFLCLFYLFYLLCHFYFKSPLLFIAIVEQDFIFSKLRSMGWGLLISLLCALPCLGYSSKFWIGVGDIKLILTLSLYLKDFYIIFIVCSAFMMAGIWSFIWLLLLKILCLFSHNSNRFSIKNHSFKILSSIQTVNQQTRIPLGSFLIVAFLLYFLFFKVFSFQVFGI